MTDTATKKPRTRTKRSLGEWSTIALKVSDLYRAFENRGLDPEWDDYITLGVDFLTILDAHGVTVQELLDSAKDIAALLALFRR